MTKPVLNQGMGYITQKLKGISVPLSAEEEKWKHTCTTENFKTEELYYSESLPWRVLGLQAITPDALDIPQAMDVRPD